VDPWPLYESQDEAIHMGCGSLRGIYSCPCYVGSQIACAATRELRCILISSE
jgi:hypothetical protein